MDLGDDYDEDITGLIVKPPIKYDVPPMYVSKYRDSVKSEAFSGKSAHKSLGVPRVSLNPPTEFLKKNSRSEIKPIVSHKHYRRPDYQHKLPSWERIRRSKSSENPSEGSEKSIKPLKNFTEENITKVRTSKTKQPQLYPVDDRLGNSFSKRIGAHSANPTSKNSIVQRSSSSKSATLHKTVSSNKRLGGESNSEQLHPTIVKDDSKNSTELSTKTTNSSGSSKTSKTDSRGLSASSEREKVLRNGTDSQEKLVTTSSTSSSLKKSSASVTKGERMCHYVSEAERAELLYGMKKKWDEMMKQFQGLPFLTDTPPKAKRKAKMEEDLKQLEKDIDLIERHPYIYVYSNDDGDQ